MENGKKHRRVWAIAQIAHALLWASILIGGSLMFGNYEHYNLIFTGLMLVYSVQFAVLNRASRQLSKSHC